MRDGLGGVQSVLLLGGTSDIGQETVRRLVDGGTRTVVLAAREPERLERFADELRDHGATTVETLDFDAADAGSHAPLVDRAFAVDGDIDVVIQAFGVLGDQEAFDEDPQAAAEAVTVNYTASVSTGLAVASRLRRQGHGTLVVLSSVAGTRVRKGNFVYGSSKAGQDGFAQGLGDALAGSGAGVLVVRPGFVHTSMTAGMDPAPFATTAGEVAEAIVEGLRRGAAVVYVPALLRWVFGVFRLLPRPLWRVVSSRG